MHTYTLVVDNHQDCCESFGYISSDDNLQQYVGAELINIKLTNTQLGTYDLKEAKWIEKDDQIQFIDLETDRGVLQLAVYNAHNGYYGHEVNYYIDGESVYTGVL